MMFLPKSTLRLSAAFAVTATLILIPSASAQGNPDEGWTRTEQTMPVPGTQTNACNGDTVTLIGQETATTRTKVQPDGSMSIKINISISLAGTGSPSGADYTYSDESVTNIDGVESLPFFMMVNRSARLIGTGVPDMYIHSVVHLTIDADGVITHDLLNLDINCNP